jgi:hypothetical protein
MSISLQDYRTLVDELKPGETMRVDHNGCDAGERGSWLTPLR